MSCFYYTDPSAFRDAGRTEILCEGRPLGACFIKIQLNKRRGENVSLQDLWCYCQKCNVMFYDGYPNKGLCAGGGAHENVKSYDFFLPYDVPATLNDQAGWRYCQKCHAMFYDGNSDKGRCPGGNGHVAQDGSFLFTLPYNRPGTGNSQSDWRYCHLCHAMFYDGYPDKGHCEGAAPSISDPRRHAGHESAGYMFVLPHDLPAFPFPPTPTITLSAIEDNGKFIQVTGAGFTPTQAVTIEYWIEATEDDGPTTTTQSPPGGDPDRSDFLGNFIHRIPVGLAGVTGAQVIATDVASGIPAPEASL